MANEKTTELQSDKSILLQDNSDLLSSVVDQTLKALPKHSQEEKAIVEKGVGEILKLLEKKLKDVSYSPDIVDLLDEEIKNLDDQLSLQLSEVMHHEKFQKIESTWRGLHHLVHSADTSDKLRIKVLNAKKEEIHRDMDKAPRFDRSNIFRKIYDKEYGTIGGEPYSVIIGDYSYDVKNPQDVKFLKNMSGLAASAHAPFISSVAPESFGLESFKDFSDVKNISQVFDHKQNPAYTQWASFRESEDSRYVGLVLPRYIGRLPYGKNTNPLPDHAFAFEEKVDQRNHDQFLWCNAAYLVGEKIAESYRKTGWYAAIRGVKNGGLKEDLPVFVSKTLEGAIAAKCPLEVSLTDRNENEFANLGLISIQHIKNTDRAVIMSVQSTQKPKIYTTADATASANLSANLSYLLVVSRIAHYVHNIVRDEIGSYKSKEDLETYLNKWITQWVDKDASTNEAKAKFPLKEAKIEVTENKAQPGRYQAVMRILPHFMMEEVKVALRLVANLPETQK